jgi:2',3'-cyclic-nucleotide 2'-phosphodiesterase / 3'-nucleotidase
MEKMMKTWIKISLLAAALISTGLSQAAELKLRIMETTDLHMNFLNYDYYQDKPTDAFGVNRTVPLIKAARAEATNSMLFDNGDLIQGSPLGDVIARIKGLKPGETHAAFKVMNQMGYDAANLGNHEFNFGLDFLRQSIATAKFPYTNSNVFEGASDNPNAKHAFTPYLILDREFKDTEGKPHKFKIGVIGFTPPQIMQWDRSHLQGKVFTRDMVEMAKRLVPEMRTRGAQLVIAIPHSGYERTPQGPMAENAVSGLAEVPGIDAILFGHSHAEFPSQQFANHPKANIAKGTINGVPSVMPGRWGDHLGIIDLTLDNASGRWVIKESQSLLRPIFDRQARKALVESDPMVEAAIKEEHEATLAYVRAKVAESSAPMYSYFAQVADDSSVQIVSNAQIAYVKKALVGTPHEKLPILSAAAPFKAGGRQGSSFYTDIPAGPIAIKNVADLYIFPNTLKAVLLTGAQVRDWIEMSAGQFNTIDPKGAPEQALVNSAFPSFNFDTLDGVTYEIDVTQPSKYDTRGALNTATAVVNPSRVKNLRYNGQPIDEKAQFIVATNNYRAFGGGNFPALGADKVILDAPEENREALVEYLKAGSQSAGGKINPAADNNWRILPVQGITMTFSSAAAAQKFLPNHKNIKLLRDGADGFATFALVP